MTSADAAVNQPTYHVNVPLLQNNVFAKSFDSIPRVHIITSPFLCSIHLKLSPLDTLAREGFTKSAPSHLSKPALPHNTLNGKVAQVNNARISHCEERPCERRIDSEDEEGD